jgi:uncharacterized protein YgiM (DUF1202 family)
MNVHLLLTGILCCAVLTLSACAGTTGGTRSASSSSEQNNLNGNLGSNYEEEQSTSKKSGDSGSSDHKKSSAVKEVHVAKMAPAPVKTEEKKAAVAPETKQVSSNDNAGASVMVVNNSKAKFRKKPSTKGVVIKTLKKGEEVKVISQQEEWYQVKLKGGDVGWCHNSVLEARP